MTDDQTTETDEELELLHELDAHYPTHAEYEGGWWELACGGCDAFKGQRLSHLEWAPYRAHRAEIFSSGLAAIRRHAAAEALKQQARALTKRAAGMREQARSHVIKGNDTSAISYDAMADTYYNSANTLTKAAQDTIAEGYEHQCAAYTWATRDDPGYGCDTPVESEGDYCPRHEPADDDDPSQDD